MFWNYFFGLIWKTTYIRVSDRTNFSVPIRNPDLYIFKTVLEMNWHNQDGNQKYQLVWRKNVFLVNLYIHI